MALISFVIEQTGASITSIVRSRRMSPGPISRGTMATLPKTTAGLAWSRRPGEVTGLKLYVRGVT